MVTKKRDLKAFRSLYLDHAEDIVILAFLLLRDSHKANKVVEDILIKVWEENDFHNIDASALYDQVRQVCQGYY